MEHIREFGFVKFDNLKDMFPDLSDSQRSNPLIRDMYGKELLIKRITPTANRRDWYYVINDGQN